MIGASDVPELDYMLARYYSSSLGRFMSVDPVGFSMKHLLIPQRWNLYAYARNNPLILVDRTGGDDFVVFNTFNNPSASQPNWGAIQSAAAARGHNVTVVSGAGATQAAYQSALATPGLNVVTVGHTVLSSSTAASGVVMSDGAVGAGPYQNASMAAPGDVNASSVNVFGCSSTTLASQYSGAGTFTGVDSGANGSNSITLENAAASFVSTATACPDDPDTAVNLAPAAAAAQQTMAGSNVLTAGAPGATPQNIDKDDKVVQK